MWFYVMYLVTHAQEIAQQQRQQAQTAMEAPRTHVTTRDECGNVFVDGVALRNPINRKIGDYCYVGHNEIEDPSRIHHGPIEHIVLPPHPSPR